MVSCSCSMFLDVASSSWGSRVAPCTDGKRSLQEQGWDQRGRHTDMERFAQGTALQSHGKHGVLTDSGAASAPELCGRGRCCVAAPPGGATTSCTTSSSVARWPSSFETACRRANENGIDLRARTTHTTKPRFACPASRYVTAGPA